MAYDDWKSDQLRKEAGMSSMTFEAQSYRPILKTVSVIETSAHGKLFAYDVLFDDSCRNARVVGCYNVETLAKVHPTPYKRQMALKAANAEWSRFHEAMTL